MKPASSIARPIAPLGPSVRLPAQDLAQIRFIVAATNMHANARRKALLLSGRDAAPAAEAIAKELRRNLYRVDLAAVVSKFIGETEKNLRRIFAAAAANGAVLLFDEADALFGKRTDVKDSHDRFANAQLALLLQRAERHRGLVMLASKPRLTLPMILQRRFAVYKFPPNGSI
jgi:AAA+ superfamily predicted ATPase